MRKLKLTLLPLIALLLAGCAGTQSAYRAASTLEQQAYVVTEHYAALVHEAADLATQPGTPRAVIDRLQEADQAVKPVIVGLAPLVERYTAIHDAKTEAELQAAVNEALIALTDFINAVKAARDAS